MKRLLLLLSLILSATFLKGQGDFSLKVPDSIEINELHLDNASLSSLFDSICAYWESSSLSNTYSYAIVTTHLKADSQLVWRAWIKQLYDYDVFGLMFMERPCFTRNFVPYGVLQYHHHLFFIGPEKSFSEISAMPYSQSIIEKFFAKDSHIIGFDRGSIEKKIEVSEYISRKDTIGGGWHWEMFVYDKYDAVLLEYTISARSFRCLKKEIFTEI